MLRVVLDLLKKLYQRVQALKDVEKKKEKERRSTI